MRVVLQPETEQAVLNWSKLTLMTLILEKLIGLLWLKFVTTYFLRIAWCLIRVAWWEWEGFGNCSMDKVGMGFKFQVGMGMGWEWEWSHWNGRELVRKICSRTPLICSSMFGRAWTPAVLAALTICNAILASVIIVWLPWCVVSLKNLVDQCLDRHRQEVINCSCKYQISKTYHLKKQRRCAFKTSTHLRSLLWAISNMRRYPGSKQGFCI